MLQHLLLITEPYFTDKLRIAAFIITNRFHNCTKPDDLIAISTPISINHAALIFIINVHVKLSHFCLQVLEVSSPTAGSALIGPSQIQTLLAARELTVRTMSAFGESVDSLPVNVPTKLPAIMSGASLSQCQSVPATVSVLTASANPDPAVCATSLSAAKMPILPHTATLDEHTTGPVWGVYINTPNATTREASPSPASYVEAWANLTSAAPMLAQEALSLCGSHTNSMVSLN